RSPSPNRLFPARASPGVFCLSLANLELAFLIYLHYVISFDDVSRCRSPAIPGSAMFAKCIQSALVARAGTDDIRTEPWTQILMNIKLTRRCLAALIACFGLMASSALAVSDYFFNTFSNATGEVEITRWFHAWGGVGENAVFDPVKNGPFGPSASSGSMKIVANFDRAGSDQQFAWFHALNGNSWGFWDGNGVLPAGQFENFEFDVYFDPDCPVDSAGRIANLEHGLVDYEN